MDSKKTSLDNIEKNIRNCTKCRLHELATKSVPGEGDVSSEIVFIGEAPGYYEDQSGRPFVGRAGKLLEKALEKIGKTREQVWIGNIIKHRPPDNRDPLPDEIKACVPYLTMQLKIIDPVMIVTLGRYAMNFFYPEGKISKDRGTVIQTPLYKVYPVYHPAAALRNGNMMKEFIKDFVKIPKILDEIKNYKFDTVDPRVSESIDEGQLGLDL